jgi:hypothetical protein
MDWEILMPKECTFKYVTLPSCPEGPAQSVQLLTKIQSIDHYKARNKACNAAAAAAAPKGWAAKAAVMMRLLPTNLSAWLVERWPELEVVTMRTMPGAAGSPGKVAKSQEDK